MGISDTFRERYDALDRCRKQRFLSVCQEWGIGNNTTVYAKLGGYSLKRIDIVVIDGVLTMLERQNTIAHEGQQLLINFQWDEKSSTLVSTIQ